MIYDKYGKMVKEVIGGNADKNEIDVIFKSKSKMKVKKVFKGYIEDFVADGGRREITEAINKANKNK